MDSARYFDKLASLRFFAALLVVLFHLGRSIAHQPGIIAAIGAPIAAYGYVGVSMFFVLSGFVISLANERWKGWRIYLSGRITRIYPPHLIVTLALFMPAVLTLITEGGIQGWLKLFSNLTLMQAWIPETDYYRSFNLVTWSLSVEISFYLVFIGLRRINDLWLFRLTAFAYLALLVFTIHLYQRWTFDIYWKLYINPLARMPEFLAGMSIYRLYRSDKLPRLWAPRLNFPLILGTMLMVLYVVGSHSLTGQSFAATLDYSIVPLPFIVLMMTALLDEHSNPWMHNKNLILLGESSFALYLLHRRLIGFLKEALGTQSQSSPAVAAVVLVVAIVLLILISVIFYKFIEVPVTHALRRRISSLAT